MAKCDLTVEKSMTINTGNYQSVKPGVSITLKDVDVENLEKEYENLSIAVSALLSKNLVDLEEDGRAIQNIGLSKYIAALKENMDKIDTAIKEYAEGALYKL